MDSNGAVMKTLGLAEPGSAPVTELHAYSQLIIEYYFNSHALFTDRFSPIRRSLP